MKMNMLRTLSIALSCLALTSCWDITNGQKIGVIVKSAREGFVIKTYECELIRGGMQNGGGAFGAKPFYFTVEDQALIPIVEKAMDEQKQVKIRYHQELITILRAESDNYFLDAIEVL